MTSPQLPPTLLLSLLPCQLIDPHHQLPVLPIQNHSQKVLHPILPFEFYNLQNRIGTLLIRPSALGQIMKIKNGSISRMTANQDRRGSRLVPDSVEIHKCANFAGTCWSNCPTKTARKRPGRTNRRPKTKHLRQVKKDFALSLQLLVSFLV